MNPARPPAVDLGPVVRAFRPARPNLLAGGVIGLLLLAGGGAALAHGLASTDRGATLALAFGAACLAGGLAFLAFTYDLARTRVELCERGFRRHTARGTDAVAWAEVTAVQLQVMAEGGAHVDPYVTVWTDRGRAYHFTANRVARVEPFVARLGELTAGHGIPWETSQGASKRGWALFLAAVGVLLAAWAPALFLNIARAERAAGGEPVELILPVYLLYQLGGKWAAVGGQLLLGLGMGIGGVVAYRRVGTGPGVRREPRLPGAGGPWGRPPA